VKALVERYVRSLKERDESPERENDLGTLVGWILDRHGYRIIERAFKHEETERRVSKGRAQFGIDILAVKEDAAGNVSSFRFVLKRGAVTSWAPGEKGSLAYDLWLAGTLKDHESRYGISPHEVTVVAVHNGDRDSEALGTVIEDSLEDLRRRHGCKTDWWDATRLADLIVEATADAAPADTTIFPPDAQPFMRMALDSLLPQKGPGGGGFDIDVVDVIVGRRLDDITTATSPETLHRRVTELTLFASMVRIESERVAGGSMLPVLDTLEHIVCATTAAVARVSPTATRGILVEDIWLLLSAYVDAASVLEARLAPIAHVPLGLALPLPAERLDYPIRVYRLCGYLAAAGLVSMAAGTSAQAEKLANTAEALWASNEGAANSPVTDDQLIELVLLFEMWAAVGKGDAIRRAALGTINRHAARFAFGYPLPSSSHRARVPMRPTTVAALVAAHFSGDGGDSVFADRGSTLLPALVYSAHRLGSSPPTDALLPLMKSDPPLAMQIWQPPGDAGQRWYLKELDDGTAVTLTHLGSDLGKVVAEFERVARTEIAASAADRLGVPAVDRLAWKLTRTPPPMKVLAELLDRVVSPPAKTKAPKRPRGSRASGK
jgi:hypothetical protein